MSVQELGVLHRRYVRLSHRFRAAWVFHQVLQSLRKVFAAPTEARLGDDFQALYAALKEASQGLTASESDTTRTKLEEIRTGLETLTAALAEEDTKISPRLLRRLIERFEGYDEKVLLQLARFYVVCGSTTFWSPDRLDKLDLLVTRLSWEVHETSGIAVLRERKHLGEVYHSLWELSAADPAADGLVERRGREIEDLRQSLAGVESLDELNDLAVVRRYRELKHGLGELFLEPRVLPVVVATNLALRNLVDRLYRQDERRIVSDYQEIFELERDTPLDLQLDQELTDFRREVERFERALQEDELHLESLAGLRQRLRSLKPRLREAVRPRTDFSAAAEPVAAPPSLADEDEEVIGPDLVALEQTLEPTDPQLSPRAVTLAPDVYPLRLEAREVVAYRRLHGGDAPDASLERFLLECAALRVQLQRRAEEIRALLDETLHRQEAPAHVEARRCLRLADERIRRLSHRIEQLVLAGDDEGARQLMVLRMRLVREHSGLWLLAYRPFLTGREG